MKKLFGIFALTSLLLSSSVQAGEDYEGMAMIMLSTVGGAALAASGGLAGGEIGIAVSVAGLLSVVSGLDDLGKKYVDQLHNDAQVFIATGETSLALERFVEVVQSRNPELSVEEIVDEIRWEK